MRSHLFKKVGTGLMALLMLSLALTFQSEIPEASAAFGTSPPWVRNDHMLPGSTYEQVVNLSRNNPDTDMRIGVEIFGDKELKKWIEIEDMDNLIMRRGETILPMNVTVKVPRRAALKDYVGDIFVTLESIQDENAGGGNVSIRLGAHILVELSVIGDKFTDYRFISATLDSLNEGDPFGFNVAIENLGNTEISELTGQVDIYNYEETEVLNSLTFGELNEPVSPDKNVVSKIIFDDLVLDPGEYWVRVKAFKNGEEVYNTRLYQNVVKDFVPVITPEDAVEQGGRPRLPSLPGATDTAEIEESNEPAEEELREAPADQDEDRLILILGIAGFAFGIFALIAVAILLVVLIKKQRQATIQSYLSHDPNKPQNPNQTNS